MTTINNTNINNDESRYDINQTKLTFDMLTRRVGNALLWFNPVFSYFFLWAPILLLVVFSFNDSRSVTVWQGFTLRWYTNIANNVMGSEARFSTAEMLESLSTSITVGLIATAISTVLGTMVSLSLARGNYPGKHLIDNLLLMPVVIPEITQGVSLLVFFGAVFSYVRSLNILPVAQVQPGLMTIVIGHVAFNISYVAIVVRARLADMNPRFEEAARDLGANEWLTFWRITFPLILPGVISGALLAFTLSLDDYVVTALNNGAGTTTLPIFVYGLLKQSVTPEVNAISTLILIVSTILIGIALLLQGRAFTKG
jgi:spermidine/putrescine transport system permease protein